ncbi:MAG: hypothetical protein ACE5JQ_16200, partial [Candidatus Methylomirabilales bacterium]
RFGEELGMYLEPDHRLVCWFTVHGLLRLTNGSCRLAAPPSSRHPSPSGALPLRVRDPGAGSWTGTVGRPAWRHPLAGRAKGAGPGPGGTLVCVRPGGTSHRSEVEVGDGRPAARANRPARKYGVPPDRPMELFRRGSPTPRVLPGSGTMGGPE